MFFKNSMKNNHLLSQSKIDVKSYLWYYKQYSHKFGCWFRCALICRENSSCKTHEHSLKAVNVLKPTNKYQMFGLYNENLDSVTIIKIVIYWIDFRAYTCKNKHEQIMSER